MTQFKVIKRSGNPGKIPEYLFTDNSKFRLDENQLVELIYFQVIVKGTSSQIQQWVHSWPDQQMRLTELDTTRKMKPNVWKIQAHAFRFRNLKFPKLVPRNPRTFLPAWARVNFTAFQSSEPLLASFVTRIEALTPKAEPYYRLREKFLLNDARLSYFLSKAGPPSNS